MAPSPLRTVHLDLCGHMTTAVQVHHSQRRHVFSESRTREQLWRAEQSTLHCRQPTAGDPLHCSRSSGLHASSISGSASGSNPRWFRAPRPAMRSRLGAAICKAIACQSQRFVICACTAHSVVVHFARSAKPAARSSRTSINCALCVKLPTKAHAASLGADSAGSGFFDSASVISAARSVKMTRIV